MPSTTLPKSDELIGIGMEDAAQRVADGKKLRHEANSRAFQPAWNGSNKKFLTESEAIELVTRTDA